MFCIAFYVPASHLEQVKTAMFAKGAGQLDHYECCVWQTLGEGQFLPKSDSQPYLGEQNKLSVEPEYKVEIVCADEYLKAVIQALIDTHPYETPAHQYWQVNLPIKCS